MTLYSPEGNRKQGLVSDAESAAHMVPKTYSLKSGTIVDVFCVDRQDSEGNSLNTPGAYTVYTVQLSPDGVFLKNVPPDMSGGHTKYAFTTSNASSMDYQNSEETPYSIGQPVYVGFLNDNNFNPVILGPAPCQMNSSTVSMEPNALDAQTGGNPFTLDPNTGASATGVYPQKQGIFQGTSWVIDKKGNTTLNINPSGAFMLQIGGITLCKFILSNNSDGYEIDFGLGGDTEPTILGTALQNYFVNLLTPWLNSHTHGAGSFNIPSVGSVSGTSAAPSASSPALPTSGATTVLTEIIKVQ